jgi:hypothetical protein
VVERDGTDGRDDSDCWDGRKRRDENDGWDESDSRNGRERRDGNYGRIIEMGGMGRIWGWE